MKWTKNEQQTAQEELRKLLHPGDEIKVILRHVSKSGMYRVLDLYIVRDNELQRLTYTAAQALDSRYDERHEGLGVGGCGMDMGFHAVYSLSRILFPEGFECIKHNCPGNDHFNGVKAKVHADGGYALRHRWM